MVSASRTSIAAVVYLAATLTAALGVRAQGLSSIPARRRNSNNKERHEFGRQPRRERRQGRQRPQRQRSLDGDLSMPLSMPVHATSLPIEELRRSALVTLDGGDLSMPLDDLSMPMENPDFAMSMPAEEPPGDEAAVVIESGGGAGGGAPMVASFLAGISALVIGAVACFVKMRRKVNRQFRKAEEGQMPEEPVPSNIPMVPYVDPSDHLGGQFDDIQII